MTDKKPTVRLWSVALGEFANFEVSIENSEVLLQRDEEFIKFPGGISKKEFDRLIKAHNDANEGVKGITPEDLQAEQDLADANEALLDSLNK